MKKQQKKRKERHIGHVSRPGQPLLFGFHAVREAWLNPAREVEALYLTEQAGRNFEDTLRAAQAKKLKRPHPLLADKDTLEQMLPKGAVHQGLALSCSNLPETGVQDFIIKAKSKERSLLVMLDQVTDPQNVGAILRSACVFGADGMVLQKRHAPDLNGVLAKAASGAVEHVPVAYETNLSRAIEELKEGGFFVIGLDERGSQTIGEYVSGAKPGHTVLVLGAEGPGMRRLVAEHCDLTVRLPVRGPIPSLNVSNAAAVALYAFTA